MNLLSVAFHQFVDDVANMESRIQLAKSIVDALSEDKEVVFIIDELDRCRPDFALRMLESIKHLFSKSRCKFYLVMNKISMVASVQRLYGLNEDEADLYLSKFMKVNFRLPSKVYMYDNGCNIHYFEYLMEQKGLKNFKDDAAIKFVFEQIVNYRKINLREVEKIANAVAIIHSIVFDDGNREDKYVPLHIFIVAYLFVFEGKVLERAFSRQVSSDEMLVCLGLMEKESGAEKASNSDAYIRKRLQNVIRVFCSDNPEKVAAEICEESNYRYTHDWYIMANELRSLVAFAMLLA